MNLRLLIAIVVLAAVALALAGWAVQGVRRIVGGAASRRPRFAAA